MWTYLPGAAAIQPTVWMKLPMPLVLRVPDAAGPQLCKEICGTSEKTQTPPRPPSVFGVPSSGEASRRRAVGAGFSPDEKLPL